MTDTDQRAIMYDPDTDRRAIIACDIDMEPCGPPGRECDEGRRCPHHGGGPYYEDYEDGETARYPTGGPWTEADELELKKWAERTA